MSPKINQAAWRQGAGFAICVIAIFALAGVPIPVAIKAVVVIATQIVSGAYIYSRIPRFKSPTISEYLGMGFAIGSALSTLCDIFLKSTSIGSVAWLLPTIVIMFIIIGQRLKSDRSVVARFEDTNFELTDLFPILVISFLYLAHDFVWYISLFVSGLCVLVAMNFNSSLKNRTFGFRPVIALTALATGSLLLGIRFRSTYWWINSDDYQLFESMQNSLAQFGPRDQLGGTGISITSYHFLSYAWTGLVDRVSAAPTWIILNSVAPVIVSVVMSALVWSFLSREGVQQSKMRFLLACLYPILFVFSFGSPSSAVGHIFLLAAVFYWTDYNSALVHWHRIPLGVLFTVFVIGTKISNAPVIVLGLGTLALIGFATNRSWKWISLIDLSVITAIGALYYFLFLRNTTTTSSMTVEPFGFAKQIFGDLNELNGGSLIVIGVIASSAHMFIPLLGMILFWSYRQSRSSMFGNLALLMFPLLALYILLIGGHGAASSYFMNSTLSVMLLVVLVAVSRWLLESELDRQDIFRLKVFSIAGIVAGFVSYFLLEHLESGDRLAMFGRATASAHWILVTVIGIIWFVYDRGKPRKVRSLMTLLGLILVGEIWAGTAVAAIDMYVIARQPQDSPNNVAAVIGTSDEIAVGVWIRSHLPTDSVIASNHFCRPEECFGADWFNIQVDLITSNPDLLENEMKGQFWEENCQECTFTLFGGSNLVLPAYSERRFLIQGPRFLWGLNDPPTWAIDRMNATLGFANNPNTQTTIALRAYGVEYFVVDFESTTQRTWLPFAKLLYQNPSFAVLKLIEEP